MAQLLDPNEENMLLCGERIRSGKLVSFPTETVYGLGADATNADAVLSIFEAKGRPLTDPVIVHIADEAKIDLILLDTPERQLIKYLGSKLWPGPLTMIGPCDTNYIPLIVGSNTGTVGVRWPNNPIACELILKADRPIAAPSANKFMHVSPTKYSHVFYDLYDKDVAIIKGGQTNLGVESTVIRVMADHSEFAPHPVKIMLLRPGTLQSIDIQQALDESEEYKNVKLLIKKQNESVEEHEATTAPGQLLKHYSPEVDCKLLLKKDFVAEGSELSSIDKSKLAVIDFSGTFSELQPNALKYVDLSPEGDFKEALHNLYQSLRDCEVSDGVNQILVCYTDTGYSPGEYGATLFDKIYRSASGQQCFYHNGQIYQ